MSETINAAELTARGHTDVHRAPWRSGTDVIAFSAVGDDPVAIAFILRVLSISPNPMGRFADARAPLKLQDA
jgi:hypothetical protein